MKKLSGIVELDESLFGKRNKYHRGNPHGGMKVIYNECENVLHYTCISENSRPTTNFFMTIIQVLANIINFSGYLIFLLESSFCLPDLDF